LDEKNKNKRMKKLDEKSYIQIMDENPFTSMNPRLLPKLWMKNNNKILNF